MNKRETIISREEDREDWSDQEIAARVEQLKAAYPDITRPEYWQDLKNALEAEKFLLAKIEPLIDTPEHPRANPAYRRRMNNFTDRIFRYDSLAFRRGSLADSEEISKGCQIKPKELKQVQQLLEAKRFLRHSIESTVLDPSVIINEFEEMYYLLMPKAEAGEENKYWKAEELGVPAMLSGAFIFSESAWSRINPDWREKKFDEEGESHCTIVYGRSVDKKYFLGTNNPLHYLGFNYALASDRRKIIGSIRHEAVHQIDFLRSERVGVDQLLSEVIARRIDGKLDLPKKRKKSKDGFKEFINEHVDSYLKDYNVEDALQARKHIAAFLAVLDMMEKEIGFARTTSILLDSLTFFEAAEKLNNVAGLIYEA